MCACAEEGSGRFSRFLDLLGDEVALQGWQNFRGGLDVKSESYISTSSLCILQGHTSFIFNTSLEAFSIWSLHMYKGIIYEALCSAMPFSVCATYPAIV